MLCSAEQFAAVLDENFNRTFSQLKYDKKTRSGTAIIPNVGAIEFRESSNDPAVIIKLVSPQRFKGTADTALDFIEVLIKAWRNSD